MVSAKHEASFLTGGPADWRVPHARSLGILVFCILLVALTRIPIFPRYLSTEGVNFAFALEDYNPALNRPHLPGYPYVVLELQIIDFLFRNREWTLYAASILAGGFCLAIVFDLGRKMSSTWTGGAAVALLLTNPSFWFAGSNAPWRSHLALMSTAVAAFAWRIWKGQTSALTPGAILLGASFGIRPSLFVYLLPVFLVSVVKGNHPKPALKRSLILVVGTATIGFLAFAWPVGDSHLLWQLAADYLNGETSALRGLLNGDDYRTWIRGFSRFVIWNAIGLTPWILVVAMRRTLPVRRFLKSPAFLFLLVWGLPAFLIQGITTVRSPGLMLPYIPAVCMLSAHFLSLMMPGRAEPRTDTMPAGGFLLASVTIVNTALFLGLFPVISTVSTVSAAVTTPSLSGAISYGLWETTVNSVRSRDEHTARWFYDIGQAGTVAGPRRIVSVEDNAASDSLLNWRVLSYYSDSEIWHIEQDKSNIRASRVFRKDVLERQGGKQVRIPVPRGSRLILIAAPDSWFIREIARQLPVQKQNLAYYVDLPPTFKPDQTSPIVFVPY